MPRGPKNPASFLFSTEGLSKDELEEKTLILQNIISHVPHYVFWKDRNSILLGCNNNLATALGLNSPQDIIGKTDYDLPVRKEEADFFVACDRQVMETGEPMLDIEEPQQRPDGITHTLLTSKVPLHDANGEVVGILGIFADITERKKQEEELKKHRNHLEELVKERTFALEEVNKQLEEKQRTLTTLMGNLPGMAYRCRNDHDWTMEFVSDGCFDLTGYQREEVLLNHKVSYGNDVIHHDDQEMVWQTVQTALDKQETFTLNYRIITASGEIKWAWEQGIGVFSEQGELLALEGFIADITAQKRAEEKQQEMLEELNRSNNELERFAYIASHDLQEPLRSIASYVQLLKQKIGDDLDAEAQQFFDYINDGASRMRELVSDLLSYSRLDTQAVSFTPIDCNEVLKYVLGNLRSAIHESSAIITHNELPNITADRTQTAQLFQNVLSNAIKYRGDEAPKIHISAEIEKGLCTFSFRDNGIGIEEQYHDQIFDIFKRLHSHNEYPGTGLGLAICRKVAEHHGGKMWVESSLKKGSTFYFSLPIKEETLAA